MLFVYCRLYPEERGHERVPIGRTRKVPTRRQLRLDQLHKVRLNGMIEQRDNAAVGICKRKSYPFHFQRARLLQSPMRRAETERSRWPFVYKMSCYIDTRHFRGVLPRRTMDFFITVVERALSWHASIQKVSNNTFFFQFVFEC